MIESAEFMFSETTGCGKGVYFTMNTVNTVIIKAITKEITRVA